MRTKNFFAETLTENLWAVPGFFSLHCSLSSDQLLTFFLSQSPCHEVSLRVSWVWSFCHCHFLRDIFIVFVTTAFLTYTDRFAYTKSLWRHIWPPAGQPCQRLQDPLVVLCLHSRSVSALSAALSLCTSSWHTHCCCSVPFLSHLLLENAAFVSLGTRRQQDCTLCSLWVGWVPDAKRPITADLEGSDTAGHWPWRSSLCIALLVD